MAHSAVEFDDEFELTDRLVEFSRDPVDRRDVEAGDGFAGPVVDLAADRQGQSVVGQSLPAVSEPLVDEADVVERGGFAEAIADLTFDRQGLPVVDEGRAGRG